MLVSSSTLLALAASSASFHVVSAHNNQRPKTTEQFRVYQDLQQAAWACAPEAEAYQAQRKRAFAQHVMGGVPDGSSLTASDLFLDEYEQGTGQKFMECADAQETKIRNNTCVLTPEVTSGPYYERFEHPVRQNIAEYEPGLLTIYNIGVLDVETCQPVPDVLVDIWQANATGHYSGHPEAAAHLVNEQPASTGKRKGLLTAFPKTKFDETFGRGAWPTNKNGVSTFTSIFPGYYTGRATHVHVKVHPEWTLLQNGSYSGGRLVHTGQFFFEDDLNMAVDKLWPYNTNPIANLPNRGRTRNWDDSLNIFWDAHLDGYHSTFETYLLGGVLQQGIVAYITMTLNMSASFEDAWLNTGLEPETKK
ncbi:aromatic compound dioxygenase [Clavulina sp. PMI_390]|nr:aromatic compound dioxygenase [Clavulina sp. PMI_390]